MMDEKTVFGMQLLKLAEAEVEDSRTIEEAKERIQKLIAKFEERSISEIYEQIHSM